MYVPSDWWSSFFHGIAVDLWLAAVPQEQTEQEATLIADALQAPAGAQLLDVPCGGGRLSLALAARGYRRTGVDLSSEFLAHAGAADASASIDWEHRDMRDLPWPARFDGAFCVGNSFGYLDDDGDAAFLQAVAAALKPGARFVLQTPMVLESLLASIHDRDWFEVGGTRLLVANHYEPASGRLDIEYTFVAGDGRLDTRRGSHRAYTYRQLCDLLERTGLTVESSAGWTPSVPMLTLIARRHGRACVAAE
jgi:SAM-dependent methyltransferase